MLFKALKAENLTLLTKDKRSQSALEYMMTYGWAILIIVIVAVILYSMGIFNPSSSITTTITGFQQTPISSAICTPTGVLVVSVEDATGNLINITAVNSTVNGKTATTNPNQLINPGNSARVLILGGCPNISNAHFSSQIKITYKEPGQSLPGPYISTGSISGTSSSFSQNTVANITNQSYITISNSTTMYNIWHGSDTYTLVYWAKLKSAYSNCQNPSNSCSAGIEDTEGCVSGSYKFYYNATYFSARELEWTGVNGCSSGSTSQDSPSLPAPYNKWVMITAVLDYGSSNALTICIDSLCDSNSYTLAGPDLYNTGSTIIMGTNQANGKLSNVQLYDTALSHNQIKILYEEGYAGIPVTVNGLIAWLPLDGNANDYSGNNNNGVATNINWVSP